MPSTQPTKLRHWKSLSGERDSRPVGEDIKLNESPKARLLRLAKITPYGGSALFRATCLDVPRALFPDYDILLGVNKRGVHFFDASGSDYWHSVMLEEVGNCSVDSQRLQVEVAVGGGRFSDVFVFDCAHASEVAALIQAYRGRTDFNATSRRVLKSSRTYRETTNISVMYTTPAPLFA
jgi:hypothetical protein